MVSCSKPAQAFSGLTVDQCLNVTGPASHSFANLGFADAKQTSFQTFLSWEVGSLQGFCSLLAFFHGKQTAYVAARLHACSL